MTRTWITFTILLSIAFSNAQELSELKQLHIVFRHGVRSPLVKLPEAGYKDSDWSVSPGELTRKGIEQQFLLGQELRRRYGGFLSDPSTVYVESTDHNRALQSAAASAAGLFPPTVNQTWNDALGVLWQPIPVHTRPLSQEYILKPSAPCPKLQDLNAKLYLEPHLIALEMQNEDLAELLTKHVPESGKNFWDRIFNLHDTFTSLASHGLALPDWADEKSRQRIETLADTLFWLWVGGDGNLERIRLVSGPLLNLVVDRMRKPDNQTKTFIYSAHDSTIAGLLSSLHYSGEEQSSFFKIPPFNAAIIVELFSNDSLRILYRNESNSYVPIKFPNCTVTGTVSDICHRITIESFLENRLVSDWEAECKIRSLMGDIDDIVAHRAAFVVLGIVFGLALGTLVLHCWWKRQQAKSELRTSLAPTSAPFRGSYTMIQSRSFMEQNQL